MYTSRTVHYCGHITEQTRKGEPTPLALELRQSSSVCRSCEQRGYSAPPSPEEAPV